VDGAAASAARLVARSGHGGAANDSKALYFKVIRYFSQIALIYNMYKQIHLGGATRRGGRRLCVAALAPGGLSWHHVGHV